MRERGENEDDDDGRGKTRDGGTQRGGETEKEKKKTAKQSVRAIDEASGSERGKGLLQLIDRLVLPTLE